jgi:hypothetical protein
MPAPGSCIISIPAFSTFIGLAADDRTVVGYSTLDKAQIVRSKCYFKAVSNLQYVLMQWVVGSDGRIATVLRNGQIRYLTMEADRPGADVLVTESGRSWAYIPISGDTWK